MNTRKLFSSKPQSKPRFTWMRSLRFRLTAWFTGALALIFLLLSALLLLGAQHTLRVQTDAFLMSEAQRLTEPEVGDGSEAGDSKEAQDVSDLAAIVSSYNFTPPAPSRSQNSLLLFDSVYLRLLDEADLKTLALSPSLSGQTALLSSLDRLKPLSAGMPGPQFSFAGPSEEQSVRVLTEAVQVGRKPVTLQVAVPWDHNADVLERLGLLLAVTLPTMLLVAAVGGWSLVGWTLRPIQRIVTEAERLDVNAPPRELLPAPAETDSEIGHLVATLNRMTMRLHQTFAAQRGFAEAQQRFAADASHELRTPLTILRGEMELALTRPRSSEAYQATLASSVEEIRRMSRIVEGLSFLARRDASQLRSQDTHILLDLSCLLHKVIADFEPQAREKEITLEDSIPAGPVWVRADDVQMQQLVGNLVDNALKYTLPGGRVFLTAVADGRVTVEDTGIGIDENDLPHIFDRFWRADQARTSGGSGLGLAICAQIAQIHGGEIRVKSAVGQGTKVELILPLEN